MTTYFGTPLNASVTSVSPVITIDQQGWDLTGLSYNDSTQTLTASGSPWAAYTWELGDSLLLVSNSGGTAILPGRYTIAGKTDANNLTLHYSPTAGAGNSSGITTTSGGMIPHVVKVSFENSTWGGTAKLTDFEWSVDFGDSGSTEVVTDWHDIANQPQVNTNNCWKSQAPMATHTYRTPGTYTVTVTARVCTALPGTYVTGTATTTVKVNAWLPDSSHDFLVDGSAGHTPTDLYNWLLANTPSSLFNLRAIFKDGVSSRPTYTLPANTLAILRSGSRVMRSNDHAFSPIIQGDGTDSLIDYQIPLTEIGFVDVVFDGLGMGDGGASQIIFMYESSNGSGTGGRLRNWSFIDCDFISETPGDMIGIGLPTRGRLMHFINCSFNEGLWQSNLLFIQLSDSCTIIGGDFSGGQWTSGQEKHCIYADFGVATNANALVAFNHFHDTSLRFACNFNLAPVGGIDPVAGWYATNNFVDGTNPSSGSAQPAMGWGVDLQNTDNNPSEGTLTGCVIAQNTFLNLLTSTYSSNGADDVVYSDNNVAGCTAVLADYGTAPNPLLRPQIYRNNIYATGSQTLFANSSGASYLDPAVVSGSLLSDNVVSHSGASVTLFADNTGASSVWSVDRNSFYSPNNATPFKNSSGTAINFAGWQGLGYDTNGTLLTSAPDWSDPANGDFNPPSGPTLGNITLAANGTLISGVLSAACTSTLHTGFTAYGQTGNGTLGNFTISNGTAFSVPVIGQPFLAGETITLSSANTTIIDGSSNPFTDLSNASVANNSNVTAPAISSASFSPNPTTTNKSNLTIGETGGTAPLVFSATARVSPSGGNITFGPFTGNTTVATVTKAGTYNVTAHVVDANGYVDALVSDDLIVTPTLTTITVSPITAKLANGANQTFTVATLDQFGNSMANVGITGAIALGNGTLSNRTYTSDGHRAIVTFSNGSISGSARVNFSSGNTLLLFFTP